MTPGRDRDEDLEIDDDEPLDADLDVDLNDEEPDGTEDLDMDDHLLDDDEELWVDLDQPEPEGVLDDLGDDLLEDEDTDVWRVLRDDHSEPVLAPDDAVVLPWSTRAQIPALDIELPAILDPTRPDSEWVVARDPEDDTADVLVRVGTVEARVTLTITVGSEPRLVLGRDMLSGRILVAC